MSVITISITDGTPKIQGGKERKIRMEQRVDGKLKNVYEQEYPVNGLDVARADSLALRRFAQLVRRM